MPQRRRGLQHVACGSAHSPPMSWVATGGSGPRGTPGSGRKPRPGWGWCSAGLRGMAPRRQGRALGEPRLSRGKWQLGAVTVMATRVTPSGL